uniref:TIL domain-containing protein n=1 Tax=Syphacia muris TaxID=451379 RepID=A0A0N5AV11_9BILA
MIFLIAHRIRAQPEPYFRGPILYSPYTEDITQRCADRNEIFKICSGCEASCADFFPECVLNCSDPKCECRVGYVRNKGECVRRADCVNSLTSITY